MKKIYLRFLVVIIALVGCTRDEQQGISRINNNSVIEQKTTLSALGYDSYESMLDDGWQIIHKTEEYESKKNKTQARKINQEKSLSTVKEKLTQQNIEDLGYSENDLIDLYTIVFNTRPDGVTINNYRTQGAQHNLLSNRYGWYAYIETGPVVKIIDQNPNELENSLTTSWITNESDREIFFETLLDYSKGRKVTWSVTSNLGLQTLGKVDIPIKTEGDDTILEVVFGARGQREKIELKTDTYKIKLPPHSRRKIVTIQEIIKHRIKYKIPVVVTGDVGLNFPSRVDGHYFWPAGASLLFKNKIKEEIVTVDIEEKSDIDVVINKPIPF